MTRTVLSPLNAPLLAARMEQPAEPAPLRSLTAALARGDDTAWARFHREFGPGIFRHLLAAARGDHDLASEALQQTYLRVARHARPCDSEPMFIAWLRVVARTALSDCRRRRLSFWAMLRRRAEDAERTSGNNSEHDDDERVHGAVEAALALLEATDRALLEAKYFSGESVNAIAERLGISSKAVESRLTRARADLRRHLSQHFSRDE